MNSRRVVDVHVATPYGVSNHLLVPTEVQPTSVGVELPTKVKKLDEVEAPKQVATPERVAEAIQFDWSRNHLKFMATIPEGEVVKNYQLVRYSGNEKLSLVNKSEFPTPDDGFAQAVVLIDGKVVGQTKLYPLKRDRYSKLKVEALAAHSLLEEAIEVAQKKLKVGQPIGEVEVVGFYQVSHWPPQRLLNSLKIQIQRQEALTFSKN